MPALNFKKQFAPMVESGEKRQTIRAKRKDGRDPQIGDTLFHYTGMRTKACRKLGTAIATEVWPIEIFENGVAVMGIPCADSAISNIAEKDGFSSITEFFEFFKKTHGLPFEGLIIKWGELL